MCSSNYFISFSFAIHILNKTISLFNRYERGVNRQTNKEKHHVATALLDLNRSTPDTQSLPEAMPSADAEWEIFFARSTKLKLQEKNVAAIICNEI